MATSSTHGQLHCFPFAPAQTENRVRKIEAFLHWRRVAAIVDALEAVWQGNFSVSQVKGTLAALIVPDPTDEVDLGESFTAMLQVFCADNDAERVIEIIRRAGRDSQAVSGWIFVSHVEAAWPIPGDALPHP